MLLGVLVGYLTFPRPVIIFMGQPVPDNGLVVNPRGKNLGDPANAERDFRKIHMAMVAFRAKYGRLPSLDELLNFKTPLVGNLRLSEDDFKTPDFEFGDRFVPGANNLHYGFTYVTPRPNGQPRPAFPATGERDVWMVCGDYLRDNQVVFRDGHSEFDPQGVEVVLWSDGTIERVPYKERIMYSESGSAGGPFVYTIAGQAGLPKKTITVGEELVKDRFNKIVSR
ncbi:MAG: hypothetical protein SFU56_08265 [Capsulimonadales bacterium]|nr:hypothetical protein [Capsulimonadales bacterium]